VYANETLADIKWYFHNEVYESVDWLTEPETSLDEFYKIRAQQIRDKYDYVILMCSGGGDSTNVLWSFLRNGIRVDEVIAAAPLSGLRDWGNRTDDVSATNTISETKLVQLPLMDEISRLHPSVKITIHDYFQNMINYKTDEWLYRGGEWIHPSSTARYDLENLVHIKNLVEQGKTIGIVYGIDKPSLAIHDGNIYSVLGDLAINVPRPPFKIEYPNVDIVLFYYTPDLPLMQVKQSHVAMKNLMLPEHKRGLSCVFNTANSYTVAVNKIRNGIYERYIIPFIYPSTYKPIFQGSKPTRNFLGEHDGWFYKLHSGTRTYEMIESDFRLFIKDINKKYMNPNGSGGFLLYKNSYKIGAKEDFSILPAWML
jgi:hypothetical protein